MTLEEARKVAKIIAKADGGCSSCVGSLADGMAKMFPEFKWTMPDDDEWYRDYEVVVELRDGA